MPVALVFIKLLDASTIINLPQVMRVPNFQRTDKIDVIIAGDVEIIDVPNRQRMGIRLWKQKPAPLLVQIFNFILAVEMKQWRKVTAQNFTNFLLFGLKKVNRLDQRP